MAVRKLLQVPLQRAPLRDEVLSLRLKLLTSFLRLLFLVRVRFLLDKLVCPVRNRLDELVMIDVCKN